MHLLHRAGKFKMVKNGFPKYKIETGVGALATSINWSIPFVVVTSARTTSSDNPACRASSASCAADRSSRT